MKLLQVIKDRWFLTIRIRWNEFWVGVRVDKRFCMGPEVYHGRGTKIRRSKGGGVYQLESIEIAVNLLPCLVITWKRWSWQ